MSKNMVPSLAEKIKRYRGSKEPCCTIHENLDDIFQMLPQSVLDTSTRALEDQGAASAIVNSYDNPYALAWRFLGVYIDCNSNNNNNNNQDEDVACQRILLWAAYRNTNYHGKAISGYSFYDWQSQSWDASTCNSQNNGKSCTRLDCHLTHPKNFELLGVYKEIDEMDDWAEQLWKHQASCIWQGGQDDDKNEDNNNNGGYYYSSSTDYDFMQNFLEDWQGGCQEFSSNDNDDSQQQQLYVDTMPLRGGNLVFSLYTDATCQNPLYPKSKNQSYTEYLVQQEQNKIQAEALESAFGRWNDLLNDFKVCQPCVAYSRVVNYDDEDDEAQDDNNNNRFRRFLNGEEGEGGAEPSGYNCYDNAGYRNCNQCYKFATQTNLEEATVEDLELASSQGTIMPIIVDGEKYGQGKGQIDSFANTIDGGMTMRRAVKVAFFAVWATVILVVACWVYHRRDPESSRARRLWRRLRRKQKSAKAKEKRLLHSDVASVGSTSTHSSVTSGSSRGSRMMQSIRSFGSRMSSRSDRMRVSVVTEEEGEM